jgi:hypothetical protein
MNAPDFDPRNLDEQIDLLVDDELSEPHRGELLRRLDLLSDGWRRCALAFLEAQCWKKELGALAQTPQPIAAPATPVARQPERWFPWGTLLAMAASFLVALGLGGLWRGARQGQLPLGGQVATVATDPQRSPSVDSPTPAPGRAPAWQMVTLAADRGQGEGDESIRLPAIERDRIDDDWLRSLPASIPPDVLRALKNTGHEVRQSRQLVPVQMPDGRRLVVPLDQVDLQYVGRPSY